MESTDSETGFVFGDLPEDDRATVTAFYERRGFRPFWCDGSGLSQSAKALAEALREAPLEGIQLTRSQRNALTRIDLYTVLGSQDCAETDLVLTQAFYRLALNLGRGQLSPTDIDPLWLHPLPEVDTAALLGKVAEGGDVRSLLRSVAPQARDYEGLIELLARYRAIAQQGGWPQVAENGPALKPGEDNDEVASIRQRLAVTGDLPGDAEEAASFYGPALEAAVKSFQSRHGLEADGVVGRQTRYALSVPVGARIDQILLNLERWRWLPRARGERYVWVNTADYSLSLHREGRDDLTMRVIVGRQQRETPAFAQDMTHLVFNPSWSVPNRIAVEDMLPKQLHDPGYVVRKNIRVLSDWSEDARELDPYSIDWSAYRGAKTLPFKFEQVSGSGNSLGRIKFLMPNPYSIYLHDTNAPGLFARTERAFSSGCIRVENPMALAEYVLGDDWNETRVANLLGNGRTQYLRLKEPVPVYLVYLTGWRDGEGRAQFRNDIYERDQPMALALHSLMPEGTERAHGPETLPASPLSMVDG